MPRDNLKKWEYDNKLKAKEVAEKMGLSQSEWSNIKAGRKNPTFKLLAKFQDEYQPEDIITLFKEI